MAQREISVERENWHGVTLQRRARIQLWKRVRDWYRAIARWLNEMYCRYDTHYEHDFDDY